MQRTHSCDNMPRLLNKTHCIVGKLVLGKERILLMAYEQAERIRSPKFIQVGQSLADISFFKLGMLDVDVIGNTDFHGQDLEI